MSETTLKFCTLTEKIKKIKKIYLEYNFFQDYIDIFKKNVIMFL